MTGRAPATDLFAFDYEICGRAEIAGADEAGRGCLAGPLVAAAVVFDYSRREPAQFAFLLAELTDSKKLTPRARERIYPLVMRQASRFSIIVAGNQTIDEVGLHRTNLRALSSSFAALDPCPSATIVDGRLKLPDGPEGHRPVTKGDSRSACIAAASIIAKVTRDRLMRRLHPLYPQYGFDRHVGYITREHRLAVARHGYCPLHRRSFKITPLAEDT